MIEREIIIGCIVSTDFLRQIRNIWNLQLIESVTAKRLAGWCWEYFEQYDKAPGKNIKGIYYQKVKEGLQEDIAEEIENNILPSLSEEFEVQDFNLEYLLAKTQKHFTERRLLQHSDSITALVENNELEEAEKTACDYTPIANSSETDLDLGSDIILDRIEKAFTTTTENVVYYPGQLGKFWNDQFIKGGLVGLLASEKRGKTFTLLDIAIRSSKQGKKVAFFQGGDMTESQLIMRICIYLSHKSNKPKYCKAHWEPIPDCIKNQLNDCNDRDRKCDFGLFEGFEEKQIRTEVSLDQLIEAYDGNPDYKPCTNCTKYDTMRFGTPWIKEIKEVLPLTVKEAQKKVSDFFIKNKRCLKVSSHANGTLTLELIRAILGIWEKQDKFIPDLIVIDYADLLETKTKMDERSKQNTIWKGLRRLSQEKGQPLVVTASQADADSYEKTKLKLKNFSEDKRKYAHATAWFGLNQDPKGREKKLGVLRINELLLREDDFDINREVIVLQNLRRGRFFLGSFW